ncbi:hypothetical protein BMS3Bbin06_01750 [bacterium BMS3Bbin06]|nr:hypothetical protein BMS3Abin08_01927 [bacterium BMS3Abin08]GBE35212.1 hypothetical protein BMS3Bbin06_01750 [bacterium BMS3Bbin06]HDO36040.1 hypothetical protein [Nitrospirota bacterium]HDY70652.1 hypothetical protein [Nitrospirota bacterium]
MTEGFAALITMNNRLHDLATAMLTASGFIMWMMIKRYKASNNPGSRSNLLRLHKVFSRIFIASLLWMLAGGIPRILTFRSFEWSNAVMNQHIPGLIVRHLTAFLMIALGTYFWIRISKKIKEIEHSS